jgi:thioredoxin 1
MTGTDFTPIESLDALEQCIKEESAVLIWFTGPDCNVCRDLKPRVAELLKTRFPRITARQVDCAAHPEISAQHQIFTIPTLAVFFDGQQFLRKSRVFSPGALAGELERPYNLFFD